MKQNKKKKTNKKIILIIKKKKNCKMKWDRINLGNLERVKKKKYLKIKIKKKKVWKNMTILNN